MKLSFYGATHEVTGSCFLLEACGKKIMIDRGMEQGPDVYENVEPPYAPGELDAVLLTHAHIDHSGLLPLLAANGYKNQIYATNLTAALCGIMLRDSAHIQEFEAEWRNRKGRRAGQDEYKPLYTVDDAEAAIKLFSPCRYDSVNEIFPGISVRFVDAGHLLGSASIEVTVTEDGKATVIVFSGDIGASDKPILRDPHYLTHADYVVMESTYAQRLHGEDPDYVAELTKVLQRTFDRGGTLVIPSFAVGRTQEMLYFLREIKQKRLVHGHDGFRVIVDSPLAVEATQIFTQEGYECYDDEMLALVKSGVNPLAFDGLELSVTSEESKQINFETEPKVIISASGMCEAGRIRHHLKHNLWKPENTILFVGYQAEGTTGRALVEGAKSVKIFGETIAVNAEIAQLQGISGHADDAGLMKWIHSYSPAPRRVFVVHGEDEACTEFTRRLNEEEHITAVAPFSGDGWDLSADAQVAFGPVQRSEKKVSAVSTVFTRLLELQKRLAQVVESNRGLANKELAKFADQLAALCDKWEK